uniref:Uncharacterized protein n=1 Tax=Ciona savignyi TaxID=51511 RepID=H2Y8U2_CIOSA
MEPKLKSKQWMRRMEGTTRIQMLKLLFTKLLKGIPLQPGWMVWWNDDGIIVVLLRVVSCTTSIEVLFIQQQPQGVKESHVTALFLRNFLQSKIH